MTFWRSAVPLAPWKGHGPGLALSTLVLYALTSLIVAPAFLNPTNLSTIFFSVAVTVPATIGMQALLLLGKFDLSIGATASLAGMLSGLTLTSGGTSGQALACAIAIGLLVGCVNGFSVARLGLDPLIATLAMMGIMRSLALASNDGRIVAGLPSGFAKLASSEIWGVNLLLPSAIAIVVLVEVAFR